MKKVAVIMGSDSDFPGDEKRSQVTQGYGNPSGSTCAFRSQDAGGSGSICLFGPAKRLWRDHCRRRKSGPFGWSFGRAHNFAGDWRGR